MTMEEDGVYSIGVVRGGTAVEPPQGGSRCSMWSCFSRSHVMKWSGVYSIWVVHGGTAVEPPSRRQQVLHVVLLFSESRHESLVVFLIMSRFSFCFEAGIRVCFLR